MDEDLNVHLSEQFEKVHTLTLGYHSGKLLEHLKRSPGSFAIQHAQEGIHLSVGIFVFKILIRCPYYLLGHVESLSLDFQICYSK